MLEHLNDPPRHPARMVILGGGGFLGRVLKEDLAREKIEALTLARADLDLEKDGADNLS